VFAETKRQLANFFGKPRDMRSKTMNEELIIVTHCHSLT